MTKESNDVHTEHCCVTHGCKYGEADCSVATGAKQQSLPCEDCADVKCGDREAVEVVAEVEAVDESEGSGGGLHTHCHLNVFLPDGTELMTVAQHSRIVAAKDAEIAAARKTSDYWKAEHLAGNAEIDRFTAQQGESGVMPEELFDGYSIYCALTNKATSRTSPENVSDVLDAVVPMIRALLANNEQQENGND